MRSLVMALTVLPRVECKSRIGGEPTAQVLSGFATVEQVFQHPRCSNCHIPGDAPLQFDAQTPHAMNVVRPGTVEIYGALLGQRMEELFAANADLRGQLRDAEARAAAERLSAADALQRQRQSLSWRITAPLRALHELCAGRKNPDR